MDTLLHKATIFCDTFKDPTPAENPNALLRNLISQFFAEEESLDISMAALSAPASSDVDSDAEKPQDRRNEVATTHDDMGLDSAAEIDHAATPDDRAKVKSAIVKGNAVR